MLLTRWNPFGRSWLDQVQQLQSEMNRLFDRWGDQGLSLDTAQKSAKCEVCSPRQSALTSLSRLTSPSYIR